VAKRRIKSIKDELLTKSKESALSAVKIFNDPLIHFKSETFIVLMVIAWTYLLHAYFRSKGIEYRYFQQHGKRRFFDKTKKGAYKYWELERCLNDKESPVDKDAANNLRFLIGLRHEIEHQMTMGLDDYLSGRYQACIMNYNSFLKSLFGKRQSLDKYLSYSLQFLELSEEQINGPKPEADIPNRIKAYIAEFDGVLTHEEYNNPNYSYRLLFKRKMVNRPGQADKVIEFIDPKSDLAKKIDKEYWVKKEVEKKKYRPSDIVKAVKETGFSKFRVGPEHVKMWKSEDAKNLGKGYGAQVAGVWYWYESWLEKCLELCEKAGDRYK
jgi:TfoX/Sxy family transcriptional regulator of competence genes